MERKPLTHELLDSRHLRLGFLASHNGTSMQSVFGAIQEGQLNATPEIVISNNSKSMALKIADTLNIPFKHISSVTHPGLEDETIASTLLEHNVDLVICSGWMKIIGEKTLRAFPNRIINIHPAVHTKYMGSQWMDMAIHEAVIADKKKISGYTIHLLDNDPEKIDGGEVLTTGFVRVGKNETPQSLQKKVKYAESNGLVALLQDISNPHKEEVQIQQADGSISLMSYFKGIKLPKAA